MQPAANNDVGVPLGRADRPAVAGHGDARQNNVKTDMLSEPSLMLPSGW